MKLNPFIKSIVLPKNANITIIYNNYNILFIFTYIKNYKLKLIFKFENITYDKETHTILLNNLQNYKNLNIINNFYNFIKSYNEQFYTKLKFKGKSYRIRFYKNNKIIKMYFNKSHKTFLLIKNAILIRINKYKFLLKSKNINNITKLSQKIIKLKINNPYTQRGLRLSRQIILKKKGKKGTTI